MKRQIRNAIANMAITIFAGFGLIAFGQSPQGTCPCPVQQPVVQPVAQPVVVQQTVEQNCTVQKTVEEFVVQQPVAPQPVAPQTMACADLCQLVRSIESYADDLRKYFRRSVRCLDCVDDSYYESVKEFERATDRLKRNYRHSDCEACDVAGDVQEVLALANCISAYMDPCSLCPEVTEAWTGLQADLCQLAGQFCTTAAFQQPVSLACPVPVCAQPTCVQPAPVIAPVAQPACPAPVSVPACQQPCPAPSGVIYK
ncbi:MAG TPA: hypothetical protein VJ810_37640 [Blastocatellia bacterium]|nr:hypothetical protein [Blastocatellia bacterium]